MSNAKFLIVIMLGFVGVCVYGAAHFTRTSADDGAPASELAALAAPTESPAHSKWPSRKVVMGAAMAARCQRIQACYGAQVAGACADFALKYLADFAEGTPTGSDSEIDTCIRDIQSADCPTVRDGVPDSCEGMTGK